MHLKTSGKLVILLLVVGVAFGAYKMFGGNVASMLGGRDPSVSTVPPKVELPTGPGTSSTGGDGGEVSMPTTSVANTGSPQIRFLHWAWNAQMGLMFANGGKETTQGSLMAKHGVNVKFSRQDDASKMQEALVAFANQLKGGTKNPSSGAHFVAIMGDGAPQFLTSVNAQLRKLGPEYKAKVIAGIGYSRGEDKFMGPESWRTNPSASKGGVVAGYLRDGDWNIAMKWLGDNGLKNNPDEKTWDPDALNWYAANDYIDACQKYIAGYTETRPVVRNGKRTGETKTIHIDGVVTWTPGDVQVASQKGGLVSIVSTKEYNYQMPCTIIGIDKWMRQNRPYVTKMLAAVFEGGAAVKKSENAMRRAAEIEADVFGEKDADADYWYRYAKGTQERDKKGIVVDLGGSSVNDLTDGLVTFGMAKGTANLFAATYTAFGDILKQQYPNLFPTYDPVDEILDTSYMKTLLASNQGAVEPKRVTGNIDVVRVAPAGGGKKISTLKLYVPFNSGAATFAPLAGGQLEKLKNQLVIASNTTVEISGHTDNVGNPQSNRSLSEARAFAVRNWLMKKFPNNFPEGRFTISAFGQDHPIAPNTSAEGRAKNRRVEIILRGNN
jgi:OOP family OmpA-OmpF porin